MPVSLRTCGGVWIFSDWSLSQVLSLAYAMSCWTPLKTSPPFSSLKMSAFSIEAHTFEREFLYSRDDLDLTFSPR